MEGFRFLIRQMQRFWRREVARGHLVLLVTSAQRSWRREMADARIYRTLAEREQMTPSRSAQLMLAAVAERRAAKWAMRLNQLRAPLPPDQVSLGETVWRWWLVQRGTAYALKHLERRTHDEIAWYLALRAARQRDDPPDPMG